MSAGLGCSTETATAKSWSRSVLCASVSARGYAKGFAASHCAERLRARYAFSAPLVLTWDTLSLPTDYRFLSVLPTSISVVSLEVPGGGDENDIALGWGSFAVMPVPEPASLTPIAFGLAGVIARARRGRQREFSAGF